VRGFVRQPCLKDQLTKLGVSLSLGSVNGSREIALSAVGILAKEDFGPPSSAPTGFEVTAQRFSPNPEIVSFPLHSHDGGEYAS
jgi:hypothetical protein